MNCPSCEHPMRRVGVKEYIEIDPADMTKATLKTSEQWLCRNPECVCYAPELDNLDNVVDKTYKTEMPVVMSENA